MSASTFYLVVAISVAVIAACYVINLLRSL
jgi:hypothetical protein